MFHVIVGSGMGLISSVGISDFAFFVLAESGFLLDPDVRHRYGARAYSRFKDDLPVITGGGEHNTRSPFCRAAEKSSMFQIEGRFYFVGVSRDARSHSP